MLSSSRRELTRRRRATARKLPHEDAETYATDAAALRSAPAETPAPAASSDVSEKVRDALIEALPNLAEAELVDLLEFVYTQHSGSNFNADNTSKAHATAVFVESRPFAISKRGVASLCKLARYSLEKSEGKPKENNAEHQLWLLMSGALNTAAAIADFDGDAAGMFDAAVNDGVARGKYARAICHRRDARLRREDGGAALGRPDARAVPESTSRRRTCRRR